MEDLVQVENRLNILPPFPRFTVYFFLRVCKEGHISTINSFQYNSRVQFHRQSIIN